MVTIETGEKNKILRTPSEEIKDVKNSEFKKLVKELRDTLKKTPNGIGLAAPQIGISKRVFVIHEHIAEEFGVSDVFVNPRITDKSKKELELEEGCLSIPNVYGFVKRSKRLKVEAEDEKGKKFKIKAERLLAHIIQHETDHLRGVLFIDTAKDLFVVKKENKK